MLDSKLNLKINKLYTNTPLFKLCVKIIIPSLLLSLLFGIYVFVDQMLIVHLVPQDNNNYLQKYFENVNQLQLFLKVKEYINNQIIIDNLYQPIVEVNNKNFIAYISNQFGIFNLIAVSFGYLISVGASVMFSQAYAKRDDILKKKVVCSSFFGTIIIGLFLSILMIMIQKLILNFMIPVNQITDIPTDASVTLNEINLYAKIYTEAAIYEINRYVYFINASIICFCLINLFVFLLRIEGKNNLILLIAILSNLVNIILDVVFIKLVKMGVISGGLSLFIGQIINLFLLSIYLIYLSKKNETFFTFKNIFSKNFHFHLIWNYIWLGFAVFLRELTMAIANVIYINVYINTIGQIDQTALVSLLSITASPLYNLFFFSMFGAVDGLRPILAFNFEKRRFSNVNKTYYIGILISFIYSIIIIFAVFLTVGLNKNVSNFFNAYSEFDRFNLLISLSSMLLQLPFLSLSVGGIAVFQSSNKKIINIILSLMQSVIVFYPLLFLFQEISLKTSSYILFIYCGFINIVISSIIIFLVTLFFMNFIKNKLPKKIVKL